MPPSVVTDIFADAGTVPLTVDAPVHTAQLDRSTITTTSPGAAGPSGTPVYAWAWIERPEGSTAAFSDATAETPTFPPDADGPYQAKCTITLDGQTAVFVESWAVGMEAFAGVWAEQVWDQNYPQIFSDDGGQDLIGGGAFTIGGQSWTTAVTGTLTTFALNANGIELTDDAGAGATYGQLYHDHKTEIEPGDIAVYLIEASCNASGDNGDRVGVRLSDQANGGGTPEHTMWLSRTAVDDWRYGIKQGAGLPDDGQLSTARPANIRIVMAYDGQVCRWYCQDAAGTIERPGDVTFRGTTAERVIGDNEYPGARPDPWSTADIMALIPYNAGSGPTTWYITRIGLYVIRGDG
jgi:hypothetical protein